MLLLYDFATSTTNLPIPYLAKGISLLLFLINNILYKFYLNGYLTKKEINKKKSLIIEFNCLIKWFGCFLDKENMETKWCEKEKNFIEKKNNNKEWQL